MSNFNDRLKELMIENNCLQIDLVKNTGLASSVVSNYYNGVEPTIKNLIILSDYFNCSVDFLLGVVEDDKVRNFRKNYIFDKEVFITRFNLLKQGKSDYIVAKEIGINNGMIANWRKSKNPSIETLIKLADYFGTSVDYLIGRSNSR